MHTLAIVVGATLMATGIGHLQSELNEHLPQADKFEPLFWSLPQFTQLRRLQRDLLPRRMVKVRRFGLIGLSAAALALPTYAQQQPVDQQVKVFTAPDGAFEFSYPNDFQVCSEGKIGPCIQSFIPACEQDAIVCIVYPAKRFEGTNFEAASFQVKEIHTEREAMTADVCVTPYPQDGPAEVPSWPEFMISARHPVEKVGGVPFVHGVTVDAATSHSKSVDLYRTLHRRRCFELSLSESESSPAASDPPMRTLTRAQAKELDASMSQILHSFRFLR